GKGVIDETHPLWLGNATLSDGDFVHRAIEHADCIINVGHDVIEKPPFFMRTDDKTVIHVNFLGAQVDESGADLSRGKAHLRGEQEVGIRILEV
ncbi:hypothetical protein MAQ58_23750, partial [Enterobacter sp. DRP3]|nr:hypothetical protein [Enterobacter sp. DRP3]